MAKFSTLSLTTIPSLPSCPTKLRTTFSHGHNQLQVLPIKFRYARHQFNKGRNMRTASTTITGNQVPPKKKVPHDFPTFLDNGDLQDTDYTELCPGLFVKDTSPKGGDHRLKGGGQRLKDGQKVEVKYSIFNQKHGPIEEDKTKIIKVGDKDLGPGFDEAIRRMSTGETAVFVIHRKLWPHSWWPKLWPRSWRPKLWPRSMYRVYKVTSINIMD